MFANVGFLGALLTTFLISVVQLFRYIAGDVDRLGWVMTGKNIADTVTGQGESTQKYQSRMLKLIQTANLAIVYQCYVTSSAMWAGIAFVAFVAVELMFKQIRKTSHDLAAIKAPVDTIMVPAVLLITVAALGDLNTFFALIAK